MAYQNVGTPRFYVNVMEWLLNIGYPFSDLNENNFPFLRTLPVIPAHPNPEYGYYSNSELLLWEQPLSNVPTDNIFAAILGHNIPETGISSISYEAVNNNNIVNGTPYGDQGGYSGFSIWDLEGWSEDSGLNLYLLGDNTNLQIGSVLFGNYYDMPHSPDLKLTMTREMDGVKRIRTKGGADLVNHQYTKPAMWTDANGVGGAAWELYLGTPANKELSRSGRRIWDLSFSYLQDKDVFPLLSSLTPYESTSATDVPYTTTNADDGDASNDWWVGEQLLDSDTFYSQVIHKTNGGQLPFIFQPDSSNNNPDQFAICKLDMNSFQFKQVANSVYNCKIRIREVW
jgi:hypothetical protein